MSDDSGEEPLRPLKGSYGTLHESKYNPDGTRADTGFKLSIEDLETIMESKDTNTLDKMGGIQGILKDLVTSPKKGISDADVRTRQTVYGSNTYAEPEHATFIGLFLEAWKDVAVIILTVAAFVSLAVGITQHYVIPEEGGDHWIEGVAIICSVLLVAFVGAGNNYSKDLQFRKLREKNKDRRIRLIRDGEERMVSIFDLVVGDIVVIHSGDRIPSDGLVIPGFEDIYVDESSLTGEPDHKKKNKHSPFMWAECIVTRGAGSMVVTAVGMNSRWGRTLALLAEDEEETPLQEKLDKLVILIGKIGMSVAIVVFLVLVIYYILDFVVNPVKGVPCTYDPLELINKSIYELANCSAYPKAVGEEFHDGNYVLVPYHWEATTLIQLLSAFIVSVTIVVVAVPEGLPLAVTISLAYSMKLMAKDQNLVRHLSACETMGGATTICSDKTGTLTENKMKVVEGWAAGTNFSIQKELDVDDKIKSLIVDACCLNNEDGSLEKIPGRPPRFLGSTTECALLVFAENLTGGEVSYKTVQDANHPVKKWGFTSARKRMSTVVKRGENFRLFTKGASELVLKICTHIINQDGSVTPIQKTLKKQLKAQIISMAKLGLRTLCLAYRDFQAPQDWGGDKNDTGAGYEEELVLIALVGIEDPIRPEVPEAVRICQNAGIIVRMVTGDNILTAKKIARDCNIFQEGGNAMEGPDFAKKSDEELERILPNLQILARSSPADKHRLVTRLKEMGEVVAVTGDGTNDGPALKAADVGLAMGIAGTEVAKQAADIIILDDNFASIVKSVMWGRCVYDNIRKFLQFQLTVNVVALVVAFIGAVTDYGTPLTAVQLLWVNLIMDTMAALALGTEKPTPDLLRRKPYGRDTTMITWIMKRNIIGQSLFQVSVLFAILYAIDPNTEEHLMFPGVRSGRYDDERGVPNTHYTLVFNTFVFMQIFNEVNSRKVNLEKNVFSGLFTNWLFVGVLVFTIVVQCLIVQFGAQAMNTVGLDWMSWCYCVGIAYMSLPWGFVLRFIPVPLEPWEEETEFYKQQYEKF